jgi:hypothetical protein
MSVSPLSAITTAAAGLAASRIAAGLGRGPSFLSLFAQPAIDEAAPPSPAELQSQKLDALGQRIQQLLRAAGIKTSLPFQLKVEAGGRVCLQSEHPQKERIEAALAGDSQLTAQLAELTGEAANVSLRFEDGELTVK